ncbi:MAG: HD domain-containing protein [Clostridia bacterium]|nr:HD domain-containing protein [Clostridia bacterium]
MTFYTGLTILTELFMLAMSLHVMRYSGISKSQKTWFLLTFLTVMLCAAAEYAVHCGAYDPKYAAALTVVTVLQFSMAPMLGVLFSGALGLPNQRKITIAFLCVNLIAETVAAPFGWVFYFNEAGYFRGRYFFLYTVLYFFSLAYLLVSLFRISKRFRQRDTGTIAMLLLVLAAGILPMTVYRIHVAYMAIAMVAGVSYIYYNDLIQQDIQAELVAEQEQMSQMQERIISGLANLIESRDLKTGERVARISDYVSALMQFARADGVYADQLNDHFISLMVRAAPLHDVGKIVVPDHILKKPGRLTAEEYEQMKRHASEGGRVVREVLDGITDEEYLSFASDVATFHHERWNGQGYPNGLSGEAIPLSARIMAIADVYDALISERCYKKAILPEEAFEIISEESGEQFDPNLAQVFLKHKDKFADMLPEKDGAVRRILAQDNGRAKERNLPGKG